MKYILLNPNNANVITLTDISTEQIQKSIIAYSSPPSFSIYRLLHINEKWTFINIVPIIPHYKHRDLNHSWISRYYDYFDQAVTNAIHCNNKPIIFSSHREFFQWMLQIVMTQEDPENTESPL